MEKYKLEYLQGILERQNESSARRYIDSLMQDEEQARSYYAEQVSMNQQEFVEMMLLDGCFIIEFLRKYKRKFNNDHGDDDHDHGPIFKMGWILEILRTDLLLFENQIPFFILLKLFDMTKIIPPNHHDHNQDQHQEENLISLAISCLNDCIEVHDNTMNYASSPPYHKSQPENIFHLLSLMYESWCSSFVESIDDSLINSDEKNVVNKKPEFSCITLRNRCFGLKKHKMVADNEDDNTNDIIFIKSVTELKQDGIKFVKCKQSKSWLDIKFESGEMKIPPLVIQDGTESILRNLIAYEEYMFDLVDLGHSGKCVTDYTKFMDCLINTPMDAQKLRVKGIIKNWMGNDDEIAIMFNNIGNHVTLSTPTFTYRKTFKKVNDYCDERRHKWISDLKKTYFKNPWSIISLLAAAIFLVLTLIQTVFSFLQHFKGS